MKPFESINFINSTRMSLSHLSLPILSILKLHKNVSSVDLTYSLRTLFPWSSIYGVNKIYVGVIIHLCNRFNVLFLLGFQISSNPNISYWAYNNSKIFFISSSNSFKDFSSKEFWYLSNILFKVKLKNLGKSSYLHLKIVFMYSPFNNLSKSAEAL